MTTEYHNPSSRTERQRAALAYGRKGIPVFPCEPVGKRPLTKRGHLDATTDPSRIHAWWNAHPLANIGIPTGKRSGLLVLDVDHPASLDELEAEHGKLPATRTHSTGSGGMHYLFRYPEGEEIRNSAGKLGFGLDVRGEGGYIVAPPSRTTRPYEVLDDVPPAAPPAWLVEALGEPHRARSGRADVSPARITTAVSALDGPPIPEGTRNDTLTSIAGRLHDGTRTLEQLTAELLAHNEQRCSPPLPEAEVRKIAGSIHRREPCKQTSPEVSPEVLEELDRFDAHLNKLTLRGMADHTMRDVLIAVSRIFRRHGKSIPAGVRGEASIREITEEAGVGSTRTTWKALNRARIRKLLRRDGTGSGPKRGALVLLTRAKRNIQPPKGLLSGVEKASVSLCAPPLSAPRLRWSAPGRGGRLGKIRGRIIDVLESRGPLDVHELSEALDVKRPRDLRRRYLDNPATGLIPAGVVECVAGKYCLTAEWRVALDKRREEDGEIEAARLQHVHHKEQSDAFAEAWRRGEVVSKEEFARRRRDRDRIRPEERHISGTVEELEPVPALAPELVEALRLYLSRNPHRSREVPSWLSVALWAEELLPSKPPPAAVELALRELDGVAA